jgi:hypothetical protein
LDTNLNSEEFVLGRHRWLMPIILVTQEAEDQEDRGSKLVPGKEFTKSYLNPSQKRAGGVTQAVRVTA